MSALTTFRDHCRAMAALTEIRRPRATSWSCDRRSDGQAGHGECVWGWQGCACTCHDPLRPTLPTPSERALWTLLADEIDAYIAGSTTLSANDDTEPLWEIS